jgi:hypothetical protein
MRFAPLLAIPPGNRKRSPSPGELSHPALSKSGALMTLAAD